MSRALVMMIITINTGSTAISGSDNNFGEGTGLINLGSLECTGDESSLFLCDTDPDFSCMHSQDAAIICEPTRTYVIP